MTKRNSNKQSEFDAEAAQEVEENRDITTTRKLPPAQFRSEVFAEKNLEAIGEYADYRAIAWPPEKAFLRVFGTDYADLWLTARIEALEHNLVYRKLFASKFGLLELDKMWDAKMAAYELLLLVNNPFTKDTTRHGAIKDLNLLFGIVIVDPNGNQKPGKDWTTFYKDHNGDNRIESVRHPDPGSEAGKQYVAELRNEKEGQ